MAEEKKQEVTKQHTSNGNNEELEQQIVEALKTVHDPEIPVNIYDLGLIYEINIDDDNNVHIEMTLTAPGCPVAGPLVNEVKQKTLQVDDVNEADVDLTFDPPWDMEKMSEEAKLELGFM
jgi:FeS assembly SUF system protein